MRYLKLTAAAVFPVYGGAGEAIWDVCGGVEPGCSIGDLQPWAGEGCQLHPGPGGERLQGKGQCCVIVGLALISGC